MAQVGCYGNLIFETSDSRILTLQNMRQKISAQWGKHKVIARKPKGEFMGPDSREITFSITLDALYGVRPRELLELVENMVETGYVDYLVIGNKPIGENRFVITSISESWDTVYDRGELARATLDITMEEYV